MTELRHPFELLYALMTELRHPFLYAFVPMFSKYYILTLQQVMYIVHTSKHAIKITPSRVCVF